MLTLIVGVFNAEGPPVPIPNTEVKLCSAENTCRATDRENKSMPTPFRKTEMFSCLCIEERTSGQSPVRSPQNASLAQLAEHVTVNHGVVGSSPSRGAKKGHRPHGLCPFFVTPHGLEPLSFGCAETESVCDMVSVKSC